MVSLDHLTGVVDEPRSLKGGVCGKRVICVDDEGVLGGAMRQVYR